MEKNLLIAKFMNVKITDRNGESAVYMFEDAAYPEYFRCTRYNTYHSDWNELMKVFERISKLGYGFEITNIFCHIGHHSQYINILKHDKDGQLNTLEMAYSCVIEFIELYNSLK